MPLASATYFLPAGYMPAGHHESVNIPSAMKIGVEKLVNTAVTGKAQASVAELADGGRVVVRKGRSVDSNLAASTANAVVSGGGRALQPSATTMHPEPLPFRSASSAESATTPCRSLLATYHFASGIVGRRSQSTRPAARLT